MTQAPVARAPEHAETFSRRLWPTLAWPEWTFGGLRCTVGSFSEALPFITEHFPGMFADTPGRFLAEAMTPAKRRYLDGCDAFLFRDADRIVGLCLGEPGDWSSYYIRTFAILPDYRERGALTEFVASFYEPLRAVGVERLFCETAPTNFATNAASFSLGWIVTGTLNTERWGSVLRFTKFISDAAEESFRRQYINGTNIKPRPRNQK